MYYFPVTHFLNFPGQFNFLYQNFDQIFDVYLLDLFLRGLMMILELSAASVAKQVMVSLIVKLPYFTHNFQILHLQVLL